MKVSHIISTVVISLSILAVPMIFVAVSSSEAPNKNTYQAVFLGKGDLVYYGHLEKTESRYVTLSDVYYLKQNQATVDPKTGEEIPPEVPVDLVKYGNQEVYRPEDALHIPTEQILYWTNLLPESPVVSAINRAKSLNVPVKD